MSMVFVTVPVGRFVAGSRTMRSLSWVPPARVGQFRRFTVAPTGMRP
jgi:hypothetical protein